MIAMDHSDLSIHATFLPQDDPDAALAFYRDTLGLTVNDAGEPGVLLIDLPGGAQVLADTLITRFGEDRAPFALGVASLLFGFPIFFDAGLVVMLPIIFSVARRFGGSVLRYALPAAGAFAVMHAFVPPHPGPVAAADLVSADIGLLLVFGLLIGLVGFNEWPSVPSFFGMALIVGGGIAGLTLAAALDPSRFDITLVEAQPERTTGAALGLWPGARRTLARREPGGLTTRIRAVWIPG